MVGVAGEWCFAIVPPQPPTHTPPPSITTIKRLGNWGPPFRAPLRLVYWRMWTLGEGEGTRERERETKIGRENGLGGARVLAEERRRRREKGDGRREGENYLL